MVRAQSALIGAIFLTQGTHAATALHTLVKARVQPASEVAPIVSETTWSASGYNPIQFFEYRLGRDYDDNRRYYRIPHSDEGGQTHSVRIHIKSLQEIVHYGASKELSRRLLESERSEAVNQRQFDAYLDLTVQILNMRMLNVLDGRETELKKTVAHSGQAAGMLDADMKDLVTEMAKLQRVGSEQSGAKAQKVDDAKLTAAEIEEAAQNLIGNVAALAKRVPELADGNGALQTERRSLELKLKRIDREIGWAEDRKIVDHVDFSRDTLDRSDAFRISFNVPFLRFDNENRARDKALLVAAEHEAERGKSELSAKLLRKRAEVYSLAAQVESMRSRLTKTRSLNQKAKSMNDLEMKSVIGDFAFELERDILLQSIRFYNSYLELLRDTGSFARFASQDLLDPAWKAFAP